MTMSHHPQRRLRRPLARLALACMLGGAGALPAACGSSGNGLIPSASAGPLKSDFEAVAQDAEKGDGSCAGTEAALFKTEQDFTALPSTINSGLRETLQKGITDLRSRALSLCSEPLAQATVTSTSPKTTTTKTQTTATTPTVTQTTSTQTTPASTTPTSPGAGGGTPAPGESEAQPGSGNSGQSGSPGTGVPGGAPGASGVGASGQEAVK